MENQQTEKPAIPETNFFAQYYKGEPAGLSQAPRPGLAERFYINMEAATRQGTVVGALRDVSRPENRHRFDSRLESFPEWEGATEGLAALSGQLAGTFVDAERSVPHLENFLPIGLGEKAVALTGHGLASLRARLFAGALDAAAVNAVTDGSIQGIEMGAGFRDELDPVQFFSSVGLGAVIGGAMGPITHRANPDAKAAHDISEWSKDQAFADPARQSDLLDNAVRSEPMDAPRMNLDTPEGANLDMGDISPLTDAKRALKVSGADLEPVALGDRLQPRPDIPQSRPDVQQMAIDDGKLANNGKWSMDEPDIVGEGRFGPVLDIEAHGKHWNKVAARLKEMDTGEAPKALDHPEFGDIDVVWGEYDPTTQKGYGLKKIAEKHPEVLDSLPDIIRNSKVFSLNENRVRLLHGENHVSVVGLNWMGEEKVWLLTSFEDIKGRSLRDQRSSGTMGRGRGHQGDTSSSSLADTNIDPKGGKIKESRRVESGTERSESHQTDTHSSSAAPTDQDMRFPAVDGKADPDLDAVIAQMDAEVEPMLQARLGQMTGEVKRSSYGVARGTVIEQHKATGLRLLDITNRLIDLTGVAAVRQGVKKPLGQSKKGVMGTHNRKTGVIRLKDPNDFEVSAHEVGHHIDQRLGDKFADLMVLYRSELEPMAPSGYEPELWLSEGFAEFFRSFLTNPNYASKQAPRFNRAFADFLAETKPEWLKGFVDIQDTYHAWRTMPSGEAVSNSIVTTKRKGLVGQALDEAKRTGIGQSIGDRFHNAYTDFIDAKHPIQQAVTELSKVFSENTGKKMDLKVKDDPYKLARMMEGAQSAGHMDLMHGVHGYQSLNPEGPALRDAIIFSQGGGNVLSKWDEAINQDFGSYLWSRRALGEYDRLEVGDIPNAPDKFTKGDHVLNVQELEAAHPHFRQAAQMVHEWNRNLWKKKYDAGLISQDQFLDGLAIKDYVPGLRKQDYPGNTKVEGKGARSGKQAQVNRFRGSNLDVINPLESLMMDAYETSIAIAHNDMIKSLKRLGDMAGHGSGRIVEEIPAREMRASIIDPIEAVEAAAKQKGYSKADFSVVRDALEASLGDEKARLFRPEVISENGQPIVFYRDGGQLRALRLADGELGQLLFQTFSLMNKSEQNMLTDMLAASASMLRTGVTAAPEFIAANIIRDQVMAAIFYGKPFKRLKATIQGARDELFSRDASRHYNAMGGIMGGENVASLRNGALNRDLKALEKKGFVTSKLANPLTSPYQFAKGLASITEISETATRLGLFKSFFDEAKLRGLDDFEAATEAAWLARDHIDFDRRGLQMVALSRIVPFLNASLQGIDKTTRLMITPLAKKAMGKVLTIEDQRALPQAVKAWARLSGLTVMGMSLHALMSQHDEYHEISETTRATHWMVKTGNKWTAIPKPFELAMILNIGEAVYDGVINEDPTARERYMDGLFQVLLPPNIMESNPIVKSYFEAKSNKDFFTGAEIIPDQLKGLEPQLQYTARTSELTKQIGDLMGWSPALTEKMITNFTGGLGRSALSLYDAFGSDKPGQSLDDMAILRRFIKSASKGSRSVRKFWELVAPSTGEFEGAVKSYAAMLEAGDSAGAADYLGSLGEEQRVYLVSRNLEGKPAKTKKLHPLDRARRAVRAITQLRKDLADSDAQTADDTITNIPRNDRGAIVDILENIAVKEARNALVMLNQPGWKHRGLMDIDGHYRELEVVNPAILEALADRYATGGVVSFETIKEIWPDYRKRLLEDGTEAPLGDLAVLAGRETELQGSKIKRTAKPEIPGEAN
ncbi:LPD38 domain-containing protein [Cohaesibacter celericrescens]|uniref:Large polyvalent protein-associated domain-containing protein n=1 Tax=Cohaesibacter celericrescens TaxID=2067669 RepID=A0A2N5XTW7_9HYPH|nr:LPD38 domain-containing protein [Cohaesibacter celericrescens]PLW77897.1 hypothetical protein C0081_07160 [Cohaesibacter celericrescens]